MQAQNEWERLGQAEANSIHYWFRQRYNLPITDPRYLNATDDQIRLEYESHIAYELLQQTLKDPAFDEEAFRLNQAFSIKAKNEAGFMDDWCRRMEKSLAKKNPKFRDESGKFTTEKIFDGGGDFIEKPLTSADIEKIEKEALDGKKT